MNEHPDLDELWLDLITEALPEREARSIRVHLNVCDVCRAHFRELEAAHKLSLRAGRIAARDYAPAVPAALEAATFRAVRKAASSPTGRRPWLAPALVGAGVAAAMTLLVIRCPFYLRHTESAARPSPMAPVGAAEDVGEGGSLRFGRAGGLRVTPSGDRDIRIPAGDRDIRVDLIAPCMLLMVGETQGLAPKGHTSDEVFSFLPRGGLQSFPVSFLAGLHSFGCEYKWTGTDVASGRFTLQVIVGTTPTGLANIKEGVLSMVRNDGPNGAVVSGVGDAAVFLSDSPNRAATTAYVKGVLLQVNLEGPDARARKGQVIALLKAAAARL